MLQLDRAVLEGVGVYDVVDLEGVSGRWDRWMERESRG